MSVRAFKYFSILSTGVVQPLIGTTLSAATVNVVSRQGHPPIQITLAVVDSSPFLPGDDAALLTTTGTQPLTVSVVSVPDATHVTVQGLFMFTYGAGSYLSLATQVNSPYVQTLDGNAAPIYIGSKYDMVVATGFHMISKLVQVTAGSQPTEFSSVRPGFANPEPLNNYWVTGTTGDKYLPSFGGV